MQRLKKDSVLALGYFLVIALMGLGLRLFQVVEIPMNYRFVVHSHSHVALLGWTYTALTTLIYGLYLGRVGITKKYRILFWCTQLTIVGMLLTFPFMGYAVFSILFSTLFLFASYVFMWFFVKHTSLEQKKTHSHECIHASLWYMVLSSLGPWALGVIMNTTGSGSDLYRNAIYFYLHFQYNGWFIMAILGLFLHFLEQKDIQLPARSFRLFFWTMNLGIVTTFCISLLWMNPAKMLYYISGLGALLQLFAFWTLLKQLYPKHKEIKILGSKLFYFLLRLVTLLFCIKLGLQLLGSFPYFASKISINIDVVIGYLHFIFLGIISIAILAFLFHSSLIQLTKRTVLLYLMGFLATEGLLFYKGLMVWLGWPIFKEYQWSLVMASGLLIVGIASIFVYQFRRNP